MSLPPLQWRKLPVRTLPALLPNVTASYCLNVIYDMLTGSLYHDGSTRTLGSGSAWQMPTKFVTGSNTEAVYVFPGFQTSVSQSVIFSGRSSTAPSSSSQPSNTSNGIVYTSSLLYISTVKNASGSFTQWTSTYPFGSGSYMSPYIPFANTTVITGSTKFVIYESKEALCVYLSHPNTRYCIVGMAGAIIDPEQSASMNTEIDGRIYAVATTGAQGTGSAWVSYGISANFHVNNYNNIGGIFVDQNSFIANSTLYYSFFQTIIPRTSTSATVSTDRLSSNWLTSLLQNGFTTISGKMIRTPLYCRSQEISSNPLGSRGIFLGRLRDISLIKNMPSNVVVRDSSNNILGFSLAQSETTSSNAVLLNYS
jgi:hypothetical protein